MVEGFVEVGGSEVAAVLGVGRSVAPVLEVVCSGRMGRVDVSGVVMEGFKSLVEDSRPVEVEGVSVVDVEVVGSVARDYEFLLWYRRREHLPVFPLSYGSPLAVSPTWPETGS